MRPSPNPEDQKIGARLRMFRVARSMSQSELGKGLGVSFQQIQKYESGANRLSIMRGVEAARLLGCTVAMLAGEGKAGPARARSESVSFLGTRRGVRVVDALLRLAPDAQDAVIATAESLGRISRPRPATKRAGATGGRGKPPPTGRPGRAHG